MSRRPIEFIADAAEQGLSIADDNLVLNASDSDAGCCHFILMLEAIRWSL